MLARFGQFEIREAATASPPAGEGLAIAMRRAATTASVCMTLPGISDGNRKALQEVKECRGLRVNVPLDHTLLTAAKGVFTRETCVMLQVLTVFASDCAENSFSRANAQCVATSEKARTGGNAVGGQTGTCKLAFGIRCSIWSVSWPKHFATANDVEETSCGLEVSNCLVQCGSNANAVDRVTRCLDLTRANAQRRFAKCCAW